MVNQMRHMLIITEGPNQGKTYPLYEMNCTLGRSADNTVVFDSSRVSRHHVQIRLLPSGAMIEDMDSTNGTWLNGQRLAEPRMLSPGDQIRLADYVTMAYVVEDIGQDATVVEDMPRPSTQMMDDMAPPLYEPRRPIQPEGADVSVEPAVPPQPAYEPASSPSYVESPSPGGEAPRPPKQRSRWLYAVIGLLIALICLCVALAVYLWFAPITFWERVFQLVGIPMPSRDLMWGALRLIW